MSFALPLNPLTKGQLEARGELAIASHVIRRFPGVFDYWRARHALRLVRAYYTLQALGLML